MTPEESRSWDRIEGLADRFEMAIDAIVGRKSETRGAMVVVACRRAEADTPEARESFVSYLRKMADILETVADPPVPDCDAPQPVAG